MTVNVARIILWQVSKQNSPRVNGMKKFRLKSCLHKLVHKYSVFTDVTSIYSNLLEQNKAFEDKFK